jgi:8-oxo-dGTP pyrophosphatase MutT (NUDIX family)
VATYAGVSDLGDLESFLRQRLQQPLPGATAQRRFAPVPARKGWEPDQQPPGARQAAALLLIYPGHDGARVALTLRRDDLPQHAGQISLPGGALDPGEAPVDAALREAHEEIGVDPATIRVVGPLSTLWVIVSNFLVQPFVAVADARPEFRIAEREVAALVEARLDHVRDASRLHWHEVTRYGIVQQYPYFDLEGHRVWGATAMMLGEFSCLWHPDLAPSRRLHPVDLDGP